MMSMANMAVVGTSTAASLFLAHHAHHYLLETNVKEESEQETLYRAPKAAAVPLATAATVVASASRIHSLVAFYSLQFHISLSVVSINVQMPDPVHSLEVIL